MPALQLENPEGPARRPNHSPAHEHVQPAVTAAIAGPFALGRLARPERTAAILPALWVAGAVALGAATGGLGSPRDWFAVAGGAVVLLAFWAIGRRRRG